MFGGYKQMAKINKGNFRYRTKAQQFEMAAKRSYTSYKKNRQKLLDEGYSLERQMGFDEYKDYMKKAKQAGVKFNGRIAAKYDKSFGIRESTNISKNLSKKGVSISSEEIRKFGMYEKESEEEFDSSTRAAFFAYLMDLGLDYHEAEQVMYS